MGVHTPEEVSQFGCADLKVLSDMLADKPFFFGDDPTTVGLHFVAHRWIESVFVFLIRLRCSSEERQSAVLKIAVELFYS